MKYSVIILLIVLSRISFAQTSKGDEYYQQAKEWLDKGDFTKALKAMENSRAQYLKDKDWYHYFLATDGASVICQDDGKGELAERIVLEAIRILPKTTPENLILHARMNDNLGFTYLNVLQNPDKAINAYSEAIRIYEKVEPDKTITLAFEKTNRGISYFTKEAYQQSIDDFLSAIALYEKDPTVEGKTLATTYQIVANSYMKLLNYDQAIDYYNKAIKTLWGTEEKETLASSYNDLANAYEEKGFYTEALDNIQKTKGINAELFGKESSAYAQACTNTAVIYNLMGDLQSALQQYSEALTIYSKAPPEDIQVLIDLMLSVAKVTNNVGMVEQSRILQEQTLNLINSQSSDNSFNLVALYMHMAVTSFYNAAYDQSLEYNFKALDILKSKNNTDPFYSAQIYNNVGVAYDELFEVELALQYKNQALDLDKKLYGEVHPDVAMAISNIGLTYELTEDYDKALEYLFKALDMRIKTLGAMHDDVGTTYLNIGLMYLKKSEFDKAILNLEKADGIYKKYDTYKDKSMILNRLAFAWFAKNDFAKASQYYQKAIISNVLNFENSSFDSFPENPDYLSYSELITSYVGKVDIYVRKGDQTNLMKGLKLVEAADAILKEKSILLNNPKDRLELAQMTYFFVEAGMKLIDKLVQITKDQSYLEKAFYLSERIKANELYSEIQVSKAGAIAKVPNKIIKRQWEIANLVRGIEQQLAQAYTTKNLDLITKLKSQLFELSKENETIEIELIKKSSAYSSTTSERNLPTWKQVSATLPPKTALVTYTITDSAKYILIGTQHKLIFTSIDAKVDLEKMVRGYRNQIKFQMPTLSASSKKLADVIWQPVEDAIMQLGDIENLIIIPDGPLSLIPFEALETKGKYVVEFYNIRYNVSGAMLMQVAKGLAPQKPSVIALAPVFEDEATNFVNKSCEPFVDAAQKTDSTSRSFSLDGEYIMPLPATEMEVKEIHKSVSGGDLFSKYFIKKDANEELIKKGELSKYDYIHFATHGLVNSQYPELSGLLLAQNKASAEDGILYTGEIYGLDLKAELVTLSACETALGKRVEGEGVRGLTAAFLFAGARTVVVSLWKVADESTAQLMINFYNQLLSGKDKSSALREAKLALLRDANYANPFYWAPFVQVGAN